MLNIAQANIAVKIGGIADIGKDEDFEGIVNNFLRLVGGVERQFQAGTQMGFIFPLLCRGQLLKSGTVFRGLKDKGWKRNILVFSFCFELIKVHNFDHLGAKCNLVGISDCLRKCKKTVQDLLAALYFFYLWN